MEATPVIRILFFIMMLSGINCNHNTFSRRGNFGSLTRRRNGMSRLPVITRSELRAIMQARRIRNQQRQANRLPVINTQIMQQVPVLNVQQSLPTPTQTPQQQPLFSKDDLRTLLLSAILGNDIKLNPVQKTAPSVDTGTQTSNSLTSASSSQVNTAAQPFVIEANGNIKLSEVKKPNGQTHIIIDATNLSKNTPMMATLKPGEDPPEPEIKIPLSFGRK